MRPLSGVVTFYPESAFGFKDDTIVCPSRLFATLRDVSSVGALPAVCHPRRHGQNRTILRTVFSILTLAQPFGETDILCGLDYPISLFVGPGSRAIRPKNLLGKE